MEITIATVHLHSGLLSQHGSELDADMMQSEPGLTEPKLSDALVRISVLFCSGLHTKAWGS